MPTSGRTVSTKNMPSKILAAQYLRRLLGSSEFLRPPRRPFPDAFPPALQMLPCLPVGLSAPIRDRLHALPFPPGPSWPQSPPAHCSPLILGRSPSLFGYAILIFLSSPVTLSLNYPGICPCIRFLFVQYSTHDYR